MTLRQQRGAQRLREIHAQQEEKLRAAREWLLQRRASSISSSSARSSASPSPTTADADALPALARAAAPGEGGRKEGGTQTEHETRSQGTQVEVGGWLSG